MFNLFEAIEGQRSEDLTTEVLAYVLQSPRFQNEQKLFYNMLLKDGDLKSTFERSLDINTQVYDKDLGKPDMEICGDGLLILIENKFEAAFSQGDQIKRYVEILKKEPDVNQRRLVVLCPAYSLQWYQDKACEQFTPKKSIQNLSKHLDNDGIILDFLSWDTLLQTLGTQSPLIVDLQDFVESRYLKNVQFSDSEIKMMHSTEIPKLLQKIEETVSQVKGQLRSEGLSVERMSQSRLYYGFHIIGDFGLKAWFGYHRPAWAETGAPFLLQIKKKWSKKGKDLTNVDFKSEGWETGESFGGQALLFDEQSVKEPIVQTVTDKIKTALQALEAK